MDVAFAAAFVVLTTGPFLVGFIQELHGSDYWIGLISAVPSLFGFVQVLGAIWGRGFPFYKKFVSPGGLLWRIFYLPFLALPFAPFSDTVKLTILFGSVTCAAVAQNMISPIYSDWMAELMPANSRGAFFGRRNAIAAVTSAAVGMVGAIALDWLKGNGHNQLGFTVLFGLGLGCAFYSMWCFNQIAEIERPQPIRQPLIEGIKAIGAPYRDKEFRRVLIFLVMFVAAQTFPGALYSAFARESLKLDFKIIQATQITMAIGTVTGAGIWFVSDKYGNKPVLAIVGLALATMPIPWILSFPNQLLYNAILLIVTHIYMGLVWSGVNLCQFNLILSTAKPTDRANYIAAATMLIGVVGGISPFLGATTMAQLRHVVAPEIGYKIVFGTSIVLRLISMLFLLPVKEEGSTHIRQTISDLRNFSPRGYRAMRRLNKSGDVEQRERAIATVGTAGSVIATEEISKALQDPQPRVRRQAARALAQLQDPRAVSELIRHVNEHPDLIEEETVEALGALGAAESTPVLIRMLQNPRSSVRRAAARALGRIGDASEEVVMALGVGASDADDPDLRRACLQALKRMESSAHPEIYGVALLDSHPSVRIAAAEAISELGLTECAAAIRESLIRFHDEGSAEVGYALGSVGNESDLPLVIDQAMRAKTVTSRRRALLGAARLLGVERETYRIMLAEGIGRDQVMVEMIRPAAKVQRRLQVAMQRYSLGQEAEALEILAKLHHHESLRQPVPEIALVAFAVCAKSQ